MLSQRVLIAIGSLDNARQTKDQPNQTLCMLASQRGSAELFGVQLIEALCLFLQFLAKALVQEALDWYNTSNRTISAFLLYRHKPALQQLSAVEDPLRVFEHWRGENSLPEIQMLFSRFEKKIGLNSLELQVLNKGEALIIAKEDFYGCLEEVNLGLLTIVEQRQYQLSSGVLLRSQSQESDLLSQEEQLGAM